MRKAIMAVAILGAFLSAIGCGGVTATAQRRLSVPAVMADGEGNLLDLGVDVVLDDTGTPLNALNMSDAGWLMSTGAQPTGITQGVDGVDMATTGPHSTLSDAETRQAIATPGNVTFSGSVIQYQVLRDADGQPVLGLDGLPLTFRTREIASKSFTLNTSDVITATTAQIAQGVVPIAIEYAKTDAAKYEALMNTVRAVSSDAFSLVETAVKAAVPGAPDIVVNQPAP